MNNIKFYLEIGSNMCNFWLKHNDSQDELAEAIRCFNSSDRIEAGTSHMSLRVLLKAREVFSVKANALIEESV